MKGVSEQCADLYDGVKMIEEIIGDLAHRPKRWALLSPRRYANTHDYFNPRLNSGFMAIYLDFMNSIKPNKVEVDCILSTWAIIKNMCPTFYVGREFAEALVCTEPPNNMVMKDLQWPFEGMVFVVPTQFQMQYFKALVPFIRVAKVPTAIHPPPKEIAEAWNNNRHFGIQHSDFGEYGIIITATVMEAGRPVDYSGSFPENYSLGQMMCNENYEVYFKDEERAKTMAELGIDDDRHDRDLLKKIISLVGHLLLALNAVPEQIEPPKVVFPLKEKIQRRTPEREWTWQPHFLGRNYRWQRERGDDAGGTHASPRLHPRRGHWRHQPVGPRLEDKSQRQHKVIWIKPMLVGAKPERTDDAKTTKTNSA